MAWNFENFPLLLGIPGIPCWFSLIISQIFGLGAYDHDSDFWFPISIRHELLLFNHSCTCDECWTIRTKGQENIIRGNQKEVAHGLKDETVGRLWGLSPWSSGNVFWSLSECKWMTPSNPRLSQCRFFSCSLKVWMSWCLSVLGSEDNQTCIITREVNLKLVTSIGKWLQVQIQELL